MNDRPVDPSDENPGVYESAYLEGIELFNECEFFEAHDVWEELWADTQGPGRRFYQGLIQVAVCLHPFGNGNIRGAQKLYHGCRSYLVTYETNYLGLNVTQMLKQLEVCCREILETDEKFPQIEIDPERIPEIHLSPAPQQASE